MPDHLEFVVRPSQAPAIRPGVPTQIFQTPKVPNNPPKVWGNAGESVFELNAHAQQELPMPEFPETKRSYDVVRVYNPDDEEQFVDTEQMSEYQGRNKISGERIVLRFAKAQNTETTKVQQRGLKRVNPENPDPGNK